MPMSAREVRQALHELGDLRYAVGDLDDALRRIVHATHRLFAVDGAGLMLIDPDQLLRNVADSDGRVDHLEELIDRFTPFGQTTTSVVQSAPVPRRGPVVEA